MHGANLFYRETAVFLAYDTHHIASLERLKHSQAVPRSSSYSSLTPQASRLSSPLWRTVVD
jgi:hypothetical protein